MKKLIMLIIVLAMVVTTTPVFSMGGEGDNTGCNGQGNPNSPCTGQGGNGGNGGNGGASSVVSTITNKINNSVKNKNSNKQSQNTTASANNEGVSVGGSSYEDNSVFIAPPSTTPMVGTVSAQITTPFGGAGFSKDAKHAKLMTVIQFINFMKNNDLLDEDRAKEDTLKVYDKLLRTVCGRYCVTDSKEDDKKEDKEVTGNGGNL